MLAIFLAVLLTHATCSLSQFSGLSPQDLDPAAALHGGNVTSLKAAYVKLRWLVDCGVCFVGHGLCSDFRACDLVVPPSQIVDTVELFRIKTQRKLSLRYLAASVLGIDIQSGSHDSIEDARTALALYAAYRELQSTGTLESTIRDLYANARMRKQ